MTIRVLSAIKFAAEKHKNQRRKDRNKTPYINHCIEVAHLLADVGQIQDENVLIAAILHDTLEDTMTQPEEIRELFGEAVLKMVEEVSDDKSLSKAERKRIQIESAPHKSHGAKLIKLGDKISNVRDMVESPPSGWLRSVRLAYVEWSGQVVAGLRGTNAEMEAMFDQWFKKGRWILKSEELEG